jgi:endonuclease/exonuclease/phosphatase family metal-dependent hydrolase
MRVVTWNVFWRFGPEWRERQPRILATLRDLAPDVVGLQESWIGEGTSQAAELAAELDMHAAVAAPSLPPVPVPPENPDQDGIELGLGLLSRWPILSVRRPALPVTHRPQAPLSLVATLDHPGGPLHVVVSCLEWEPDFRDDQLAQSAALATLLDDPALDGDHPVLLLADLNAEPGSPEVRQLTDVAVDTWTAGGGDPGAVTLSSGTPWAPLEVPRLIDQRIDWVLARPGTRRVRVTRAFLAGDRPVDGLLPSDHFAVVADLVD